MCFWIILRVLSSKFNTGLPKKVKTSMTHDDLKFSNHADLNCRLIVQRFDLARKETSLQRQRTIKVRIKFCAVVFEWFCTAVSIRQLLYVLYCLGQDPCLYDPSAVLAKFPFTHLYEERAVLLGYFYFRILNHVLENGAWFRNSIMTLQKAYIWQLKPLLKEIHRNFKQMGEGQKIFFTKFVVCLNFICRRCWKV